MGKSVVRVSVCAGALAVALGAGVVVPTMANADSVSSYSATKGSVHLGTGGGFVTAQVNGAWPDSQCRLWAENIAYRSTVTETPKISLGEFKSDSSGSGFTSTEESLPQGSYDVQLLCEQGTLLSPEKVTVVLGDSPSPLLNVPTTTPPPEPEPELVPRAVVPSPSANQQARIQSLNDQCNGIVDMLTGGWITDPFTGGLSLMVRSVCSEIARSTGDSATAAEQTCRNVEDFVWGITSKLATLGFPLTPNYQRFDSEIAGNPETHCR